MRIKTPYIKGQLIGPAKVVYLYDLPSRIIPSGQRKRMAMFQCSCGKEFEQWVRPILHGKGVNCGCGAITGYHKNGLTGTKSHSCWCSMKVRCLSVNASTYPNHGGRGITIYGPWVNDPLAFHEYVSKLPGYNNPKLTLDRINNDGNYEPGNLRWATISEQNRNRRPHA